MRQPSYQTYTYKGFEIQWVDHQQWNISRDDETIDATSTLAEAKYLINCGTRNKAN